VIDRVAPGVLMFTRSSSAGPKPLAPEFGNGAGAGGACNAVVALQASARVTRDSHHMLLAIAHGVEYDGRRPADASQLTADIPS
jgi:hypothetical protein